MTPHVEMHDSTRFYSECGGKTACGFTAIWCDEMIACCKSLGVHYQINFTIAYENRKYTGYNFPVTLANFL